MDPLELGIEAFIRDANIQDSPEARGHLAEVVLSHLATVGGELTPERVHAGLLEWRTARLLGLA